MEPRAPSPTSAAEPAVTARSRTPVTSAGTAGTLHAPIPPGTLAAASRPAIVALAEDQTLLQALTRAVIEQAPVVTSPSVDRFVDQLVANGAEVALIDAATAPAPLDDFVMTLRRRFPHLLMVLAGSAPLQSELSAQIADGTIFRFAHKPASAQRLRLFINAALHSTALQNRRAAGAPPRGAPAAHDARRPLDAAEQAHLASASRAPWLWPLVLSLTALGALAIGWFANGYMPHRHPPP